MSQPPLLPTSTTTSPTLVPNAAHDRPTTNEPISKLPAINAVAVNQSFQAAQVGGGQDVDTFVDRVVKFIPAEIVGAWVAAKGVVEAAGAAANAYVLWVCFAVGVTLTALYTLKKTAVPGQIPDRVQTGIATVAFVVWAIALGEPFSTLFGKAQQSLYGSLLLIAYTVGVALVVKNPVPPTSAN